MAPEETLLDPPITPAHLFAYRALRGWVVGSPHSSPSPERKDTENIEHVPAKIITDIENENGSVLRLSPQKRKRNSLAMPLSPTKSILRTSGGVPTPRAKSLRDVNVKFKSASPEMRREEAKLGVEGLKEKDSQATAEGGIDSKDDKPSTKASAPKAAKFELQPLFPNPATLSDTSPLEDQNHRTAKEMKRLVRYGTKWRDFARQRDEENAKLRVLLEDARIENRRLEAALRKIERGSQVAVVKESRTISATIALAPEQRSSSAPTSMSVNHLLTNAPDTQDPAKSPASQLIMPAHALPRRPTSDSNPSHTPHTPLTALQHRIEGSILPISDTAARTGMDPKRLAATRKRLTARTQARKAGGLSVLLETGARERG